MAPNTPIVSTPTRAEHSAELVIPSHTSLRLELNVAAACQGEVRTRQPGLHRALSVQIPTTHTDVQPRHVPDWSNIDVIHRNTLPPRSHFLLYDVERDALAARTGQARSLLLSGLWGFDLTDGPFNGPRNFYKPGFDASKWPLVKVPGMWSVFHRTHSGTSDSDGTESENRDTFTPDVKSLCL